MIEKELSRDFAQKTFLHYHSNPQEVHGRHLTTGLISIIDHQKGQKEDIYIEEKQEESRTF